jgi:serine/threonine protein kinase
MLSVVALPVTDMDQKYHLACEIALALRHCHALGIVHSDLCCCNILMTRIEEPRSAQVTWSVKVANTGVFPDSDSFDNRRVYFAPEVMAAVDACGERGTQSIHLHSPTLVSSSPHSPNSPPLDSRSTRRVALHTSIFSKESDVYALGITLLQLFRHTLNDCKESICSVAAESPSDGLKVPLFPQDLQSSSWAPIPSSQLQRVISSCTRRDPRLRPSAAEIWFVCSHH